MSSRSFDGDRGFVSAAQGVLEQNTNELTEAVTSVDGATTGAACRESWTAHIRSLVRYSDALAADDRAGQREARSELAAYASRYGQLMATATNGKLDATSDEQKGDILYLPSWMWHSVKNEAPTIGVRCGFVYIKGMLMEAPTLPS